MRVANGVDDAVVEAVVEAVAAIGRLGLLQSNGELLRGNERLSTRGVHALKPLYSSEIEPLDEES